MDLNTLGIIALSALSLYIGYTVTNISETKYVQSPVWNEQAGKSRSLQAKGDASLMTEMIRRRVIQTAGRLDHLKIKESRTLIGSTTGAIETFMISGICPLPGLNIRFDGGGATDEFCPLNGDDNGISYDAGGATDEFCRSNCDDIGVSYDGGGPIDEFCPLDGDDNGVSYDAGGANTEVCKN